MKKLFTLMAVAAMALTAMATEFTVFDGTATDEYVPICSEHYDWGPYYGQIIYPAEQLDQLKGKEITSVKFYIANDNGNTMSEGKVGLYLGTTTETAYGWDPSYIGGLTKVAEIAMTAGETEVVFELDGTWVYNGDNLVLQTLIEEDGSYSGTTYFYGVAAQTACAVYGGNYTINNEAFYPKTTFTYEGGSEDPGIAPLSEVNALEDGSEFKFGGDAVVTVFMNGYLFLRDESGYGMIPNVEGTFENGQVLAQGWNATKTSVNDWVRYTDATGLSASGETNAELAAPIEATTINESMLNSYVVYKNVMFSMFGRHIKLPDENETKIYYVNTFNIDMDAALFGYSGPFNAYGIIGKDTDGNLRFMPTLFEDYTEPEPEVLRGDVNSDNDVTIADVAMLIDYLLMGDAEAVGANLEAADCNLDEDVSIADVAALIDYLLIGHW